MVVIPEAVREYIDIVKAEEYPVCKEQKLLIEMIERILREEELYFDLPQLEKYLSYQKYFPFKLFPWEKFVFALHNTLYKAPGLLRFPIAFLCVGRGTGKTGYSSFENFCLLTPTNGVKQYDIYTFATSERQAKMAWEDMYDLLEAEPAKFRRFFHWTKEVITNLQTNSSWYYCTSSAGTKDGQRPGKVDFDEYHAYQDYKLIDVAVTGLGKKKLPRRTITTTNGIVRGGPFDDLFSKCIDILNGDIPDNGLLPFICRIDSEQEVHDKAAWHKANPSLRYLPDLLAEMELEYTDYVVNPVANVSFIAKRMNLPPVQMENEVTSWENLMIASRRYDTDILRGRCCVGGIDYASTTDIVAAGLLFRKDEIDYWLPHAWVCEKSPDLSRIKAPLREWAAVGLLTFVNAPEIPPDLPAAWLAMKAAELNATVLKIGIDKYRYTLLAKALKAYKFSVEKGCENIKLLRPSDEMANIPAISAKFAGGRICWDDNPMMRWFANNSKIDMSASGNMTYQKIEPKSRKTDGFKAFAAAECVSEVLDEAAAGDGFLSFFYGD
ncbi:MAG: terminase TerL endonuclease subunit [Ruminiclostridium sp.]